MNEKLPPLPLQSPMPPTLHAHRDATPRVDCQQMFKGHRADPAFRGIVVENLPRNGQRYKLGRTGEVDGDVARGEHGAEDENDTQKGDDDGAKEKHAEETNKINSNYNTLWKT